MRKITLLFFLLFCVVIFSSPLKAEEIIAQSRIEKVTIFSGNAMITRVSPIKLNNGQYKVIFPELIPEIDDNSIRVSGAGSAEVKILGAQLVRKFLEDSADKKVRELEEAIQGLRDELRKLTDLKNILQEERVFLDSLKLFSRDQLPQDLATKMPQAAELEGILKFLSTKLADNFSKNLEADIKIRDLAKKEQALNAELSRLISASRRQTKSIVVDLEVTKPGDLKLALSYMVGGASWYPVYDARVNFDKSEVELISQAVVKQNSGDNWQNVAVTLSSAKVNISASMPEIDSWFIRPLQRVLLERKMKVVAGAVGGFKAQFSADFDHKDSAMAWNEKESMPLQQEANYQYAQAQEQGVSVVYQIKRPQDILSDGSEYKLPVSSQILKSEFEYSAYPRLSGYSYLRSKVRNAKELQLISGRVNIFLDGSYVGSSLIKNIAPEEEFDLYMGIDENVKVKRELVEKKSDDTLIGGIPSPNKKTTYKYKLSAENYKGRKIKISIFDNIPVSQDDKIKVVLGKVSLEPKDKDWKDKPGLWRWELELEPRAKQDIFISYFIEHPRNLEVEGI